MILMIYLLDVLSKISDNAGAVCIATLMVYLTLKGISFCAIYDSTLGDVETGEAIGRGAKILLPIILISGLLYIVSPSKTTMYTMIGIHTIQSNGIDKEAGETLKLVNQYFQVHLKSSIDELSKPKEGVKK